MPLAIACQFELTAVRWNVKVPRFLGAYNDTAVEEGGGQYLVTKALARVASLLMSKSPPRDINSWVR